VAEIDLYEVARQSTEDALGPGYWHDPRPGACPGCMICDKERYMVNQQKTVVVENDPDEDGVGAHTAKQPRSDKTGDAPFPVGGGEPKYESEATVGDDMMDKPVQGRIDMPEMGHAPLTVDGEAILFGNRIVGEFDGQTLTLNAGWCRLAGLGLKVDGDSSDRRRVVFERRSPTDHHLSSRA
jgi:hypothetical protein